MPENVKVDGLRELAAALRRVDRSLPGELREANKAAAQVVSKEAIRRVPARTGRLRNTVRALASQRISRVKAGTRTVPYAGVIHFGWRARNIRPRPFLWDALDTRRSDVIAVFERHVEQLTQKVDAVR